MGKLKKKKKIRNVDYIIRGCVGRSSYTNGLRIQLDEHVLFSPHVANSVVKKVNIRLRFAIGRHTNQPVFHRVPEDIMKKFSR